MSLIRKGLLLPLLASVFIIAGCEKNDPDEDFPSTTNLKGRVLVQNEFGQPLYNDRNGISAVFETGFRSYTANADQIGYWQLTGAPVGEYTITYKKAGCGPLVFRNVMISTSKPRFQVIDGFQELPTPTLTRLPNTTFSNMMLDLTANQNGGQTLYNLDVKGTMVPGPPPTGQAKGYRVFIARSATVSKNNYEFQKHYTSTTANFIAQIGSDVLSAMNVQAGQTLHVVVYGDANFDLTQTNPNGSLSFPNLTPESTSVLSVVLP